MQVKAKQAFIHCHWVFAMGTIHDLPESTAKELLTAGLVTLIDYDLTGAVSNNDAAVEVNLIDTKAKGKAKNKAALKPDNKQNIEFENPPNIEDSDTEIAATDLSIINAEQVSEV